MLLQPTLQDLGDQVQSSSLYDPRPYSLAPPNPDIDDTLECQAMPQGDLSVDADDSSGGRTVQAPYVRRGGAFSRETRVSEDVKESFESTV